MAWMMDVLWKGGRGGNKKDDIEFEKKTVFFFFGGGGRDDSLKHLHKNPLPFSLWNCRIIR